MTYMCHKILCPSISASADCSEQRKCIHYANGSLTVLIAVYSVDEWFWIQIYYYSDIWSWRTTSLITPTFNPGPSIAHFYRSIPNNRFARSVLRVISMSTISSHEPRSNWSQCNGYDISQWSLIPGRDPVTWKLKKNHCHVAYLKYFGQFNFEWNSTILSVNLSYWTLTWHARHQYEPKY